MVSLRAMGVDDVALIERWDEDADVAAALGGRGADWYDWPVELGRVVPWRELLIAEDDARPIGFVQLADAHEEETHYWGEIAAGTWTIDIWIGDAADRGRGLGSAIMRQAIDRCLDHHQASSVLIDPMVTNGRAIEFYRRLGFEPVGERAFDDDVCLVMRFARPVA